MSKKQNIQKKDIKSVTFNYIKSDNFHSVLATGVIGGITINSLIDMNFFTDRVTIPQTLTMQIESDGKISKEINRETKQGTVREVHFGALVDLDTAKNLVDWLREKIDIIEKHSKK